MTTLDTDGHPLFWPADEQDILQALNEARQMEVADPNPARRKQWSNYACELSLALKEFQKKEKPCQE